MHRKAGMLIIGGPMPRRTEPFPRDVTRLEKGAAALALPEPTTLSEMKAQLSILGDGVRAMQSLDDLGNDEANRKALRDHDALMERYLKLKARLEAIGPLPWKGVAKRLRSKLADTIARLEEVQHCCDKAVANRAEIDRLENELETLKAPVRVSAPGEALERISQVCPFDLDWPFRVLLEALYAQHACFRAYHNLRHLEEMASAYAEVRDQVGWQDPRGVFAALLLHDAVLIGGRNDNELKSAELAFSQLPALISLGVTPKINIWHVSTLIRLTAQHGRITRAGLDHDEVHFLDCDMLILAAPRERFLEYNADIAREYEGIVSREAYRDGRRAFLARLAHPEHRVFLSDFFHGRLEQRAKANLGAALELL